MPRPLSEEVDDAVREVECIKAALSSTGEDGQSYLGMRGHVQAERLALLQLLHLSLSTVDRLREKEIEVLKASTAAAAAAGQCTRVGKKSPQRPVTSRACRYKIVAMEPSKPMLKSQRHACIGTVSGSRLSSNKTRGALFTVSIRVPDWLAELCERWRWFAPGSRPCRSQQKDAH